MIDDSLEATNLSVVIPVRNGADLIENQLKALADQAYDIDVELVISDNGSTDNTVEICKRFADSFSRFIIVDSSDRAGVCYARNIGALASSGGFLVFCDHDDVVRPGYLAAMSRGLSSYHAVGGVAISEGSAGELAKFEVRSPLRLVMGYLPSATGAALGVRRSVFTAVQGFDMSFQKGADETDFCWRVQRAGFTLGGVPDAVVDYRQRDNLTDAARQFFHYGRTHVQLWAKYRSSATIVGVSFVNALAEFLGALRHVPRLRKAKHRFTVARELGWAVGVLGGHVRYNLLRRLPEPELLNLPQPLQ